MTMTVLLRSGMMGNYHVPFWRAVEVVTPSLTLILIVRNMVKNRKLSKSISDAAWSAFRNWLEYFACVFGVATVAVPPHYTSQNCSNCGEVVKKSLSTRTHKCHHCGFVLDRDWNAARNILELGLRTVGHTGTLNASEDIDKSIGGETPFR